MKKTAVFAVIFLGLASSIAFADTHCPPDQEWDNNMSMCMPKTSPNDKYNLTIHSNDYLYGVKTTGLRGDAAAVAPDMSMIDFTDKFSQKNKFCFELMPTIEKWTIPARGTPELGQVGDSNAQNVPYVDHQHPHPSPIMGLTVCLVHDFDKDGKDSITYFFAPRGEATAGPEVFLHRPSATGNIDAPDSHHLQDFFHVTSTVIGTKIKLDKTTIEASTFSGVGPSPEKVDLDIHTPDSYAVRVNQQITKNVNDGASLAFVVSNGVDDNLPPIPTHDFYFSSWVTTQNNIKGGVFNTSTIWGQRFFEEENLDLKSALTEGSYRPGGNNFYYRVEALQRTPGQLDISIKDPSGSEWIETLKLGYERRIRKSRNYDVYLGGAGTDFVIPTAFRPAYGNDTAGIEGGLRLEWKRGWSWGH